MGRSYIIPALVVAAMGVASCADEGSSAIESQTDSSTSVTGSDRPIVRPGRADWSTGYFQAAVFSQLLDELGYEVTDPADHEYPVADAYVAMADGTFDFWANGWFSQHEAHFEQELDDGSTVGDHMMVVGDEVPGGAPEGLVITKSVADEYSIESLDQINGDPDLVALFDSDGDGLAEVQGCPEDWTCDDIIAETIAGNGWSNLEQLTAGYDGMVTAAIEKVEQGEPVIQYVWTPSANLTVMVPGENVLWLSMGGNEHVIDGSISGGWDYSDADPAPLGDACTQDPCWVGWEVSDIRVAANREFAESNPSAHALLEAVTLPMADIIAQNVRYDGGENTDADVRRHADEWIAEHRDQVDQWLAAARAAA